MKLPLHVRILIGMGDGVPWVLLSSFMDWSRFNLDWIDPFGRIFINLLKLVAVPLVLFSIITAVSGMGEIRRLGPGLGPAWVAISLIFDRPLDMMRTVVNVTGDAAMCSVVAHSQREKLFTNKEKLEAA